MQEQVWVGTVELEYTAQDVPRRAKRAFTNITTWAGDYDEFCRKANQMLEHYGWRLLRVEQARPIRRGQDFGEELRDMIERTRANRSAVIYGTFHTYPSGRHSL